jgi:hypothetical protein
VKVMKKFSSIILQISLLLAIVFMFSYIAFAAESNQDKVQPVIHILPISGEIGEKVVIYGAGFEPEEKVKIILQIGNVPLQWAEADTGGVVIANVYGAFKLVPRGGIPIAASLVEPGVYVVRALGDKGSQAIAPIEILEKTEGK